MKEKVLSLTAKDFIVERKKGSGKGGQNKNKRETAILIKHTESGCEAYCCDERSQHQNLMKAFKTLSERMKPWLKMEHLRKVNNLLSIEQEVEKSLVSENLKVEGKNKNGEWEEIKNKI